MSLKILLLFTCLIINGSIRAQNAFDGGVLLDLHGIGLLGETDRYWNTSKQVGAGHGGYSVGLLVKRDFPPKVYSLLQIRYSTKGSLHSFTGQYGVQSYESLYLNYVELPLLIGYKINRAKKDLYLETGFAYARLINSKLEAENKRIETPTVDGFKTNDLVWIGNVKIPIIEKWEQNFLAGISISCSIISIHQEYKIYNFEYGFTFNYLFN